MTEAKKEIVKPGYNAPVERDPHQDMLASISMDGDIEVARWFHKGKKVFTVRTSPDGSMIYKSAVDE